MKRLIRFASLFVLMFAAACAQADTQATATDSGVDGLSPVYTDGACHFKLKVVSGEGYSSRGYTFYSPSPDNPNSWGFGFGCNAGASQETIDFTLDAKMVNGKWIWSDASEPFTPAQRFKTYPIHGKNWTGRVTEYNDTTGDEVRRARNYDFCLFETGGPQILCGQLRESLRFTKMGSEFRKALNVIKTIVFVDPQAEKSSAPGMSGGVH